MAALAPAPAATGGSSTTETYPKPDALANETGAELWLRYPAVPIPGRRAEYVAAFKQVVKSGSGATTDAAAAELIRGLSGLTGTTVAAGMTAGAGSVVVGTGAAAPIQGLPWPRGSPRWAPRVTSWNLRRSREPP